MWRGSTPLVIGHLGWGEPPGILENTLAAFALAFEEGADAVELDVRLTLDGKLAVTHDETVIAGGSSAKAVSDLSFAQLPDHVITLDEALDFIINKHQDKGVNIEIKNSEVEKSYDPKHAVVDAVVDLVRNLKCQERVLISCFDMACIDHAKRIAPEIDTAWLVLPAPILRRLGVDAKDQSHRQLVETLVQHGHSAINPAALMVLSSTPNPENNSAEDDAAADFMTAAVAVGQEWGLRVRVFVWAAGHEMDTNTAVDELVRKKQVNGVMAHNVAKVVAHLSQSHAATLDSNTEPKKAARQANL